MLPRAVDIQGVGGVLQNRESPYLCPEVGISGFES